MRNQLLIIIFIFSFFISFAQRNELVFEKILDNNEKAIGYITDIKQDKNGFIWFTTLNGLYRYDGYEFKIFKNIFNDTTSLPYNSFQSLYIDSEDIMWLICRDGFGREAKSILSYHLNIKNSPITCISSNEIISPAQISEDKHNNIWISTRTSGLFKYNKNTKQIKYYFNSMQKYNNNIFALLDSIQATSSLFAEILQVTNKQKLQKPFSVTKNSHLVILSLGEGSDSELNDYSFITSGKDTVWKMEYNETKYAGGASRNRISIETINLKAGKYILNYNSDDIHSFGEWEEPKPDVVDYYGVKIMNVEGFNTNKLNKYIQNKAKNSNIISNKIRDMKTDKKGRFWILTGFGVSEYEPNRDCFINYNINFCRFLNKEKIKDGPKKFFIENNIFWIATNKSLIKYNITDQSIKVFKDSVFRLEGSINSIYKNTKNQLLLAGRFYLHIFDINSEKYIHYRSNENNIYRNTFNFFEDKSATYWISSYEGLNKANEKKFDYSELFSRNRNNLEKNSFIDSNNTIWYLTTSSNKLSSYQIDNKLVNEFVLKDKNLPEIAKNNINREYWLNYICQADKNNLWLAISNGLFLFNIKEGKILNSFILVDSSGTQKTNEILRIFTDKSKRIWIFTTYGIYELINGILTKCAAFDLFNDLQNTDIHSNIDFIIEDNNRNLWIRAYNAVYVFNSLTYLMKKIILFNNENCSGVNRGNIHIDSDKSVWLATCTNLYKININNYQISKFIIRDTYKNVIWNLTPQFYKILETDNRYIWISSNYGLIKFDRNTKKTKIYTDTDGLIHNRIEDFILDKRGLLWLATKECISRFDPHYETFINFSETYFLAYDTKFAHQNCNTNELNNGNYLFFTSFGISAFNPNTYEERIPPVAITNFLLYDKEYQLDTVINLKKRIELNYEQNFFSFVFAVLDFTNQKQNRYAYKLEGVDKNWVYCDARQRLAKYTNVVPGRYIFKVKGANSDGIWNENGVSIIINILPPWYKTKIAYLIYFIFIIILIYLIIKFRERKFILEKIHLEKLVNERTAQIKKQNEEIIYKNKALQNQKEEILTHRDELQNQRDLLQLQKQEIVSSIQYAKSIQQAVLPNPEFLKELSLDFFVLYKPKDIVSGDFYWLKRVENQIIMATADCTGHGVPGAFMSMLGMSLLNEIVSNNMIISAGEILNNLRNRIKTVLHQDGREGEQKDGMDIALCIIDLHDYTLQFSGAYNSLYLIRNNILTEYKADRQPCAIYSKEKGFRTYNIQLQKNDILYTFTDGYSDQTGGISDRKFLSKNFRNYLLKICNEPLKIQKDLLNNNLENWMSYREQIDDITVVGVKIC